MKKKFYLNAIDLGFKGLKNGINFNFSQVGRR